jgi:hypothetical protein
MRLDKIRTMTISILVAIGFSCLSTTCVSAAQLIMRLNVIRYWSTDGTVDFSIEMQDLTPQIFVPSSGRFEASVKLTAPDGSVTATEGFLVRERHLSFADLQSRFVGTWTIQELGPSDAMTQFSLLPFTQSSFVNEQPLIVSPHEGDVLPPTFNIDWTFPSGKFPKGLAVNREGSGQSEFTGIFLRMSKPARYTITDTFVTRDGNPVSPPEEVTLRAGSYNSLETFLLDPTPVSGVSPNTYDFFTSGYLNFSAPITVTVIPEPGSLMLVGLCIVGTEFWRRRKKSCVN